eukprot:gnl/TRDRNA2_/TRDRNA2_152409_c0_seq2.p1 gnl/TRDRNA2_/TRDRNA2_152409_c0~~gnl/TRDRNA2_/TRDRNA2_152409_c0_seq2.p1  ORF type:complete len:350 (-),score=57.01 gnl/TRDRNA2_/TRDRNA2_152409_c0_seq2:50-1099(-)
MGDASALVWSYWRMSCLDRSEIPLAQWAGGTWALEMHRTWSHDARSRDASQHVWRGLPGQAAKLNELEAIINATPPGDVHAMIAAIARHGASRARWLKLAAGGKALVLGAALRQRPLEGGTLAIELGSFVGYSALHIATVVEDMQQRPSGHSHAPSIVCIEKDSGCAQLARSTLARAGVASVVNVWNGRSTDLLPRLLEEFGAGSVGFAFFDHSGSIYHEDLAALEQLQLLAPGAVVVADNVLKPGAPLFLWHLFCGAYSTRIFSVREFVQTSIEDWMVVCTWNGPAIVAERSPPAAFLQLSWEADAMRRRSERSGVSVQEWAEFAQRMRVALRVLGFEAEPWAGSLIS